MNRINVKSENGAVTLFVLTAMMFLMIVLLSIYASVSNKSRVQKSEINKIEQTYNVTEADMQNEYDKIISSSE
jgi:hypothetical protein